MSERIPCRVCGTEVLPSTFNVTGGLCGRCARGHKLCDVCKRHFTSLEPNKEGRLICSTCVEKARKTSEPSPAKELYTPTATEWAMDEEGVINHPVLGVLTWGNGQWTTAAIPIGAFGYPCAIGVEPEGDVPSQSQMDVMVNISRASTFFKNKVAKRMAAEYSDEIRPAYAKTVDDPRYGQRITLADLPKLNRWNEVWQIIKGLNSVTIDEEGNLDMEFAITFDPSHDFAVRLRDGTFYEVMLDG